MSVLAEIGANQVLMSGAVGYTLQMAGQKYTDPALASLIMSLEAVFSALTAWVLLQERMSGREVLGSVALFAAVIYYLVYLAEKKWIGDAIRSRTRSWLKD